MCIHQDRTAHLYIGLAMVIIALIGLNQDWHGELGRLLFLGILSLGAAWALLLGGLAPLIIMLLVMPFFFVGYVLFLPVKKRGDKIYHQDNPVVAYWMRDDRIVLVIRYYVHGQMNTIGGESVFRGRRQLARMREMLDSTNVPEQPVIEEQLENAVEIWNRDPELGRRFKERRQIDLGPSEALIVLDEHSKERVDRVHHVIGLLWDSEAYQDTRQEIIQLAVWNALAVDVCYGEKRGFWKEWA